MTYSNAVSSRFPVALFPRFPILQRGSPEWTIRLHQIENAEYIYFKTVQLGAKKFELFFSFKLSDFLKEFHQRLEQQGIKIYERYYYGTLANYLIFGYPYSDIDYGALAEEGTSLSGMRGILFQLIRDLSKCPELDFDTFIFGGGLENQHLESSCVSFTLPTTPKIDLSFYNALQENPCSTSSNCFQVVLAPKFYFRTVGGYDWETAETALSEGTFYVDPPERAFRIRNGLFCYVRLLMKGLIPRWFPIEEYFCRSFAIQYANLQQFSGSLNRLPSDWSDGKKFLFYVTLECAIGRSQAIYNKICYSQVIRDRVIDWDNRKLKAFFSAIQSNSYPYYTVRGQMPRYFLTFGEGFLFVEPPSEEFYALNRFPQEWVELYPLHQEDPHYDFFYLLKLIYSSQMRWETYFNALREVLKRVPQEEREQFLLRQERVFQQRGKSICLRGEKMVYNLICLNTLQLKQFAFELFAELESPSYELIERIAQFAFSKGMEEEFANLFLTFSSPQLITAGLQLLPREKFLSRVAEGVPSECRPYCRERIRKELTRPTSPALLAGALCAIDIDADLAWKALPLITGLMPVFPELALKLEKKTGVIGKSIDWIEALKNRTPNSIDAYLKMLPHVLVSSEAHKTVLKQFFMELWEAASEEEKRVFLEKLPKLNYENSSQTHLESVALMLVKGGFLERLWHLGLRKSAVEYFIEEFTKLQQASTEARLAYCRSLPPFPFKPLLESLILSQYRLYFERLDALPQSEELLEFHETLLKIIGMPLSLKGGCKKALLASDNPKWFKIGLELTDYSSFMQRVIQGVPENCIEICQEYMLHFLSMKKQENLILAGKALSLLPLNRSLMPAVRNLVQGLIMQDADLALKLLRKMGLEGSFEDWIEEGLKQQGEEALRFCIQLARDPKRSHFLNEGTTLKLMQRALEKNLQADALLLFQNNWKVLRHLSKNRKEGLLKTLTFDPALELFVKALDRKKFNVALYQKLLAKESRDQIFLEKQRICLSFIGEVVPLPGDWESDEAFLLWVESHPIPKVLREAIHKRFKEVLKRVPEKCAAIYLKLKKPCMADIETILAHLPEGADREAFEKFALTPKVRIDHIMELLKENPEGAVTYFKAHHQDLKGIPFGECLPLFYCIFPRLQKEEALAIEWIDLLASSKLSQQERVEAFTFLCKLGPSNAAIFRHLLSKVSQLVREGGFRDRFAFFLSETRGWISREGVSQEICQVFLDFLRTSDQSNLFSQLSLYIMQLKVELMQILKDFSSWENDWERAFNLVLHARKDLVFHKLVSIGVLGYAESSQNRDLIIDIWKRGMEKRAMLCECGLKVFKRCLQLFASDSKEGAHFYETSLPLIEKTCHTNSMQKVVFLLVAYRYMKNYCPPLEKAYAIVSQECFFENKKPCEVTLPQAYCFLQLLISFVDEAENVAITKEVQKTYTFNAISIFCKLFVDGEKWGRVLPIVAIQEIETIFGRVFAGESIEGRIRDKNRNEVLALLARMERIALSNGDPMLINTVCLYKSMYEGTPIPQHEITLIDNLELIPDSAGLVDWSFHFSKPHTLNFLKTGIKRLSQEIASRPFTSDQRSLILEKLFQAKLNDCSLQVDQELSLLILEFFALARKDLAPEDFSRVLLFFSVFIIRHWEWFPVSEVFSLVRILWSQGNSDRKILTGLLNNIQKQLAKDQSEKRGEYLEAFANLLCNMVQKGKENPQFSQAVQGCLNHLPKSAALKHLEVFLKAGVEFDKEELFETFVELVRQKNPPIAFCQQLKAKILEKEKSLKKRVALEMIAHRVLKDNNAIKNLQKIVNDELYGFSRLFNPQLAFCLIQFFQEVFLLAKEAKSKHAGEIYLLQAIYLFPIVFHRDQITRELRLTLLEGIEIFLGDYPDGCTVSREKNDETLLEILDEMEGLAQVSGNGIILSMFEKARSTFVKTSPIAAFRELERLFSKRAQYSLEAFWQRAFSFYSFLTPSLLQEKGLSLIDQAINEIFSDQIPDLVKAVLKISPDINIKDGGGLAALEVIWVLIQRIKDPPVRIEYSFEFFIQITRRMPKELQEIYPLYHEIANVAENDSALNSVSHFSKMIIPIEILYGNFNRAVEIFEKRFERMKALPIESFTQIFCNLSQHLNDSLQKICIEWIAEKKDPESTLKVYRTYENCEKVELLFVLLKVLISQKFQRETAEVIEKYCNLIQTQHANYSNVHRTLVEIEQLCHWANFGKIKLLLIAKKRHWSAWEKYREPLLSQLKEVEGSSKVLEIFLSQSLNFADLEAVRNEFLALMQAGMLAMESCRLVFLKIIGLAARPMQAESSKRMDLHDLYGKIRDQLPLGQKDQTLSLYAVVSNIMLFANFKDRIALDRAYTLLLTEILSEERSPNRLTGACIFWILRNYLRYAEDLCVKPKLQILFKELFFKKEEIQELLTLGMIDDGDQFYEKFLQIVKENPPLGSEEGIKEEIFAKLLAPYSQVFIPCFPQEVIEQNRYLLFLSQNTPPL
jgi:hypothetical protein